VQRFVNDEELKDRVNELLNEQAAEFYSVEIEKLFYRYDRCLNIGGSYVEKWFKVCFVRCI